MLKKGLKTLSISFAIVAPFFLLFHKDNNISSLQSWSYPLNQKFKTTTNIPLDPEHSVILFTTKNHNSKNTWFKLNQIRITLAYKSSDYLVDIPIIILKPLPKGHASWKCTYVFGSINNCPNSCVSSNSNFFSNNCFHLKVPESVFYNAQTKNTENIYCQITVNFMIWNPINNKWFNWYYYDLTTRIDYFRLINCDSKASINSALKMIISYKLVSSFTIKDGKLINIVTTPILFIFENFVSNYQTSTPVSISLPRGIVIKAVTGWLDVPKINLFNFSSVILNFSLEHNNNYRGSIEQMIYYDLLYHKNFTIQGKAGYYISGHSLFYNYLAASDFYISASVFVSSYVNLTFTFLIKINLKSAFDSTNPKAMTAHRYRDNFLPNMKNSDYHIDYDYDDIKNMLR